MATSRRPAATPAAASSTVTTPGSGPAATKRSSSGCSPSRRRCPRSANAVDRDLARRGLPRDKVLAAVIRLLELTLIRVGNDEYAKLNRSFGLTTLRDRHARVEGASVRFRFRGKSGRQHEVDLRDRRLATVVRRCQDLPGQELFQYVDKDGEVRDITSDDVNAYLREASGGDFTAKDVRTWAATVLAYRALLAIDPGRAIAGRARRWWRRSVGPRTGSATRRPSHVRAMSTRHWSTPISRAGSAMP